MSACDVYAWCDGDLHDSTDEHGRRLHSRAWKILGGHGDVTVLLRRNGSPAFINISIQNDGDFPPDEVRGFADVEPAEYERALRDAADFADKLNQTGS